MKTSIPLCVDLDGTLLNSDLLLEAAFAQLKQTPLAVWCWPRWLANGKARLKAEIAARVDLDIATLPYNRELLTFLREQKQQGRTLVLVTASHRRFADEIAAHLGLFDAVLATDGDRNLAGPHKAETLVECYGERGFDYAGNAAVDLAVWGHARRALVVNAAPRIAQLFLSLALVKRYAELWTLREQGDLNASGRGYQVNDLSLLQNLGGAAGYLAVLVLALYINSETSRTLYGQPMVIWLLCPALLYWISRVWLITHRGEMHDDPIIFALTDTHSRYVLLACTLILLGAMPK